MHAGQRLPAHRISRAWAAGRVQGGRSGRPLRTTASQALKSEWEMEIETPYAARSWGLMASEMGFEVMTLFRQKRCESV